MSAPVIAIRQRDEATITALNAKLQALRAERETLIQSDGKPERIDYLGNKRSEIRQKLIAYFGAAQIILDNARRYTTDTRLGDAGRAALVEDNAYQALVMEDIEAWAANL